MSEKPDYKDLRTCKVCDMQFNSFLPLNDFKETLKRQGYIYNLEDFETLNLDELFCPACKSTDRERMVANLLREKHIEKSKPNQTINILDLSSPSVLGIFLRFHPSIIYQSAAKDTNDNVDFQNVDFKNLLMESNKYDIVLCLHVLENEVDDKAILKEVFRVIKPGGKLITVSPINLKIKNTLERKDMKDDSSSKHFMLPKHQRVYSKEDFINLIKSNDFVLKEYKINNYKNMGLSKTATIYEGIK